MNRPGLGREDEDRTGPGPAGSVVEHPFPPSNGQNGSVNHCKSQICWCIWCIWCIWLWDQFFSDDVRQKQVLDFLWWDYFSGAFNFVVVFGHKKPRRIRLAETRALIFSKVFCNHVFSMKVDVDLISMINRDICWNNSASTWITNRLESEATFHLERWGHASFNHLYSQEVVRPCFPARISRKSWWPFQNRRSCWLRWFTVKALIQQETHPNVMTKVGSFRFRQVHGRWLTLRCFL